MEWAQNPKRRTSRIGCEKVLGEQRVAADPRVPQFIDAQVERKAGIEAKACACGVLASLVLGLSACSARDVILAVSASGSTLFTVAAVDRARSQGAGIIAIVCREHSVLAENADVVICADTPDEVVSGSTRLAAGLAQKILLNTISTVSMVRLGRTMHGQMVCVEPLNEKLAHRIVRAISTATAVDEVTVRDVLERAGRGDVAVVALTCGIDVDAARVRLQRHHGNINLANADGA
jgi:N-acetylmuramic acid 6-phosphate etherase